MSRRLTAVFVLLAAVGVATPATAQGTNDPIAAAYRQYFGGDKTGAISALNQILKTDPGNLPARFASLAARNGLINTEPSTVPAFEKDLDALIDMADARHSRTDKDTEATFYLAQAAMLRAGYRFDHDKGMWGAARDAAKAKKAIDSYIKVHPEHDDAYYVEGLYNYYVDLAPAFAKMLRFMLFIPGGDRKAGLQQLERAATRGTLFAPDANLILIEVYSTYENRPADAVSVAEKLQREFPRNDDVAFELARTYASPAFEQFDRAGDVYASIADRHANDQSPDGLSARYRAIQSLAAQRLEAWRVGDAIAALTPTIDAKVMKPDSVLPQFLLRRANYRLLLNDPGASDDVARVLAEYKTPQWQKAATDMQKAITDRRTSGEAARSAALIPANRLVMERKYDEARKQYQALLPSQPNSPQLKYRLAYVDFVSGQSEQSMATFAALAANKANPDALRANSLLQVARAHDLAGRRAVAIKTYEAVADQFEKTRAGALARIGLVTPYKRPGS